ncbi:hypothetical protein [Azospirillum soli]|uniref:hypothetical protein n=1 Tax=Azospirillum soli TaxID=1304799 RepID=UPI001AE8A838|nr:hypothetical protein [Azospirillum soli]MBP2315817.1 hypothetical protein [Azospirillum soli]
MNGIYSVLSDSQTGMYRLQQSKKQWERDLEAMQGKDATQRLTDKADLARQPFALTPQQQRDHASAMTAMEEAKRIGGPKAAAEQRLAEVERKIQELKMMMRHAQGDREKLAQLAREAAILAREAGKAAKEYGAGIAAAAEMGKPGGAGVGIEVERTITRTSLTVVQTEMSIDVTVTLSPDAQAAQAAQTGAAQTATDQTATDQTATGQNAAQAAMPPPLPPVPEASQPEDGEPAAGADAAEDPMAEQGALPAELADLVNAALAGLQSGLGSANGTGGVTGDKGRDMMQRMLVENDMKMSRYKEADAFGRRVEQVLGLAKSIIGEAKAANELEQSEERRKARKEAFKGYDKILEAAQDEVNDLRKAAFGSSVSVEDFLNAASDATGEGGGAEAAAVTAGPALAGAQTAVNLLA